MSTIFKEVMLARHVATCVMMESASMPEWLRHFEHQVACYLHVYTTTPSFETAMCCMARARFDCMSSGAFAYTDSHEILLLVMIKRLFGIYKCHPSNQGSLFEGFCT